MRQTLFILGILLLLLNACSQVVPPTGGKKDTLAPELVKSIPLQKQTNYTGKIIDLSFNEDVRLDNPAQKILITPQPDEIFKVRSRPDGFRLIFDKPLQPNTTYTFNFTDAVKDINENNPAMNLKLVFSTGSVLDSLRVGGKVVDLRTGQPLLNSLVGLYIPNDTLTPIKNKPYYFTRTDSSGNFSVENIRSGQYRVFAFDDKNLNVLYNPGVERIAFLKDSLVVNQNVDTLALALFPYYNTPPRVSRSEQRANTYTLVFDRGIRNIGVRFNQAADSLPSYQRSPNELTFFNSRSITDTVRVQLTATDSLNNTATLNQTIRFRQAARRETPEALTITTIPANSDDVDRNLELMLQFNKPISRINADSLQLLSDSLSREVLTEHNLRWENNRTRLVVTKAIAARRAVRLNLGKGAFISVLGDSTAAARLRFGIRNEENYGTLSGTLKTSASQFIIELLDEAYKVVRTLPNQRTYRFLGIKPGKYRLRVIIDINGNGRWDSGDLAKRQQPEPIYYYSGLIPVRQNFELNGIDLEAP